MVRPQLFAVSVLAAVAMRSDSTRASRISSNPYTPGGKILSLTHAHPAFGSAPPPDSLSFAVANGTDENAENREATVSTDIERLEAFFNAKMIVNYQELAKYPKGAAATAPWPSSYWPTYADGINAVWNPNDKMAPSEKYARAYGLDVASFQTKVSQTSGVLSQAARLKCSQTTECASLNDGSACAKRVGEPTGVCIPMWFGICHAWAPAAIEEREPSCPVTKNGVTFQPFDIKALMTQMYDGAKLDTVFTGTRFNGADSPINMDSFGRYNDPTRRDVGAGFFHIALVNIFGIRKKAMVVDVDQDAQVWNQPARGYEVISATPLTPAQAATTFWSMPTYVWNRDAASIVFIQLKFQYIVESGDDGPLVSTNKVDGFTTSVFYEYCLELDAAGNVIGGEWVRNSKKLHPDFLWFPANTPTKDAVSDIGLKYKDVRELLDASADCRALDAPGAGPTTPAAGPVIPAAPAPAPGNAPAPATPAAPTTPTAPATPPAGAPPAMSLVPVTAGPAPSFDTGRVSPAADGISAISEWLRRWMAGRSLDN